MPQGKKRKIEPETLPEYSRRIADLRAGRSRAAFAALLMVSPMALSHWENGTKEPGSESYLKLAKLSGGNERIWFLRQADSDTISLAVDLIGNSALKQHYSSLRSIPVLRDAAAAGSAKAIDEREIEYSLQMPRQMLPPGGDLRGLKVEGTSMSPFIETGYVVILDVEQKKPEALVDRMVVASDAGLITIKWLRKIGDRYTLSPHNISADNPDLILVPGGAVELIGAVVKWIGQPDQQKRK